MLIKLFFTVHKRKKDKSSISYMDEPSINTSEPSINTSEPNINKLEQSKQKLQKSLSKNIKKPSLKRISLQAGCKRIESETYDEMKSSLQEHLRYIIRQSLIVMQHDGRNMLTLDDFLYALRIHNNSSVYI